MNEAIATFSLSLFALLLVASVSSSSAQTVSTSPEQKPRENTAVSVEKASANNGKKDHGPISRSTNNEGLAGYPQRANNSTGTLTGRPLDESAVAAQKHYETGLSFQSSGKYEEAIFAFKQAIKLVREHAQAHYGLGMTYHSLRDYKKAGESFKLAVQFHPHWPEAHFKLGLVSYVLGRMSVAVEEYKTLQKLNSSLAHLLERVLRVENSSIPVGKSLSESSSAPQIEILPGSYVKESPNETVKPNTDAAPNGNLSKVESSGKELALPVSQPSGATTTSEAANEDSVLTGIYKVGVGDVLDIRLLNTAMARSTLYTVANGGVIDLPLAGRPIMVVGLTTDEIQTRIAAELKRLALQERAQVSVGIRQYASHDVIVTGLLNNPGTRFLRREAVPLYVIMAEAQLRPDAGRISILRGGASQVLDVDDPAALNLIVKSGDVINVTARPPEFYYVGGRIKYPGQKIFQSGITVLQAILAAGGVNRQNDNKIELSREAADGRLITSKYGLKEIKAGKIPDPKLKPGDRVEVVN